LDAAIGGKKAATAGIKGGIVFEDRNSGFNGIEGRSATRKKGVAGLEGIANASFVGGFGVGGNGPGAAMDEKSGNVRGGDCHWNMVAQFSWISCRKSAVHECAKGGFWAVNFSLLADVKKAEATIRC
jgi:hypothetical protein